MLKQSRIRKFELGLMVALIGQFGMISAGAEWATANVGFLPPTSQPCVNCDHSQPWVSATDQTLGAVATANEQYAMQLAEVAKRMNPEQNVANVVNPSNSPVQFANISRGTTNWDGRGRIPNQFERPWENREQNIPSSRAQTKLIPLRDANGQIVNYAITTEQVPVPYNPSVVTSYYTTNGGVNLNDPGAPWNVYGLTPNNAGADLLNYHHYTPAMAPSGVEMYAGNAMLL